MTDSVNPAQGTTGRTEATIARNATRTLTEAVLSAARIVVSFLFFCHGLQGLFGAFGGVDGQGTAVPSGLWPYWWASAIDLIGGGLLLLGLFTRPVAVLCSGVMAYAYFTEHQPQGLLPVQNMGEPATLYSWVFLLIAVMGPGSFALDTLLRRRRAARKPAPQ